MFAAGALCALIVTVTSVPVSHDQQRRQASLPCDHPLRVVVPSLFSHCGTICAYSNWISWAIVQRQISTTSNTCTSKRYYVQQRTRQVVSVIGNGADCNEVNETQNICEFQIIIYLMSIIVDNAIMVEGRS